MGVASDRGGSAETLVRAYLELLGFEVLGRNRRLGGVEVDLIAAEGGVHVLIEVKYRGRADYGGAALAVNHAKRERLLRAARTLESRGDRVRIDVVAVELAADGASVRHYRNAVTE